MDEVALGDAVEEVWHLLDWSHGREPGDILISDAELELGSDLWRALDRAPWPVDPQARMKDTTWGDVADRAAAFLDVAADPA